MAHGVADKFGISQTLAFGEEDLHGKLVAIGIGEESHLQGGDDQTGEQDQRDATKDGHPRATEGEVEHLVVSALYPLRDGIAVCLHGAWLDDTRLEERNDAHSQSQRHHQVDGDRDGEVLKCIVEHTLHRDEVGVEDGTDTDGGEHHRHEVLLGRVDGCTLRLVALAQVLQIAVDDHDGVVDNHSQHHDEGCEGDDIQFDAHHIHDRHRDKRTQGYGDRGHDGRAQGEEHHHDEDDDDHGNDQVAQEGGDTERHDLRLVSDTRDLHVAGQLVLAEIVEHTVDVSAILHHVVAWRHLHRQQHTGVAILFDTTGMRRIFAHHTGHIPDTGHLTRHGVGEDNLIGYLLLRILHRLHIDGHLLVVVADAATEGGDALSLQAREEHLLTNAIGLQTLAVDVEGDLFLLGTREFHIGHRGDATQTIGEAVAITLQLTIAALVALDGHKQGRGIAKVVVDHDGEHTRGELRLEVVQSVLDLTPHLVLIIHVVVELHHHDTHAVLRL